MKRKFLATLIKLHLFTLINIIFITLCKTFELFYSIMLIFFFLNEFERTETSISNRYITKTNFGFHLKFKRVIHFRGKAIVILLTHLFLVGSV